MKKIIDILVYLSTPLLLASLLLIFFYAPEEKTQGIVQKIFYFHVASAFAMYAGFGLAGFFALLYLGKRKISHDCLAHAGSTVGLVFCTMVLASGPLWAKPVWGTWWTWDPRLTTTLLIWLIFFSCFLLRRFFGNDPKGKIAAAILTLFGVVDIPLIFLSVKLWRGIHPSVLGRQESMPVEMRITLIVSLISILVFFFVLYFLCYQFYQLKEKVEGEIR